MKTLLISLLLLISFNSFSQSYRELKIGDQVPDITIKGFFDDDKKSVKISELYRHKLLILDFWGTWCGSCLDEMMTFPKLKEQFGDKLNIVAVGYESKERISGLFKRNPIFHSDKWITLYGDSVLTRKLFPHHLLPHIAWIDSTGKVIAITSGENLNVNNIVDALKSSSISARIKVDNDNSSLDVMNKPFRQMDTDFIARSIFTRGMKGGGLSFDSMQPYSEDKHPVFNRNFNANGILYNLYWRAVFPIAANPVNGSRLIFEVKDSLRWTTPKRAPQTFKKSSYKNYDEWADSNSYCYELILPKKVPESVIRSYMLSDLNRYLNFNGRWEEREMFCYAIQDTDVQKTEFDIAPVESNNMYYKIETIENISVVQLTDLLNKRIATGYIVNESIEKHDSLVQLNTNIKQGIKPSEISFILKKSGLKLVRVKRKVPVYVVSE